MNTEKSIRGQQAKDNFNSGYNCSQSVLLAYEDYLREKGLNPKTVLRMASPMGGGISRLREVCGAVSALCLLIGLTDGYDMPDDEKKKALYSKVQELVLQFQESKGSIICRELLGLEQKHDQPIPSKRTKEYYAERPCADFCATAAALFEKNYLQSKQ
ncbi:C_GCAxxG_C_C family probable redox protein [Selenomonas ruminantium]|jgi:C_GCAxxG_C_C family probable redox protein|uniref:C_GCAxxG_C_C family probable redox protein n=1 Tax=Selenomonas ruminantium TaxID=971 RepID=A0A1M6XZW8_SELRU|nr:C-GCAxxG-C-C family protein [Selenomonas ruminantium]SHL11419.1 C_GCAxxG_C_C family probable redox protein [Selenomonas ruminantium]